MSRLILIFIFILSILEFNFGQSPPVKVWDRTFGGNDCDGIYSIDQTTDGGFILGGYSLSNISGDKSQNSWGSADYWIVKIDLFGNKQWDKDFGGINIDGLRSIQQTFDGGYILGGSSEGNASGDKTQNSWGVRDYWILKTDSLGNKLWDKDFGGTDQDELWSIQQTTDGGYILAGHSLSNISGDKTQNSWGNYDYWIIKTDSLGNKQWDRNFGGTGYDYLYSIQQTSDTGYILGGYSSSNISGDKTQNSWGIYDYWIIKIDSAGNKQWDRDYGGNFADDLYSIQQTSDNGYILGGISSSNISGDKTEDSWGITDYWILKTDSAVNKQWDKDFGGISYENDFYNVFQSSDNGYLISGLSKSPVSGNKTENNLGIHQSWIVKTDSLGVKQWDKTLLTNSTLLNGQGRAIQTADGCYLIASWSDGGIAGHKSQPSQGCWDYWIVKLCDSTSLPAAYITALQSICPGSCLDFTNLSTNALTFQWSFPGATPDTSTAINPTNICYPNPGSYDVQLIASNASGSDTLLLSNYITVYPSPPAKSITQSGDTLFAIAGSTSYQWYFNGNSISGATDYFYGALASGDYNVVATDSNGCEVEAAIFNVIAHTLSLTSERISIYPIPVSNEIFIKGTDVNCVIHIYNVFGEKIYWAQKPGESPVNVEKFSPGVYVLEAVINERIFRFNFLKQ